jgi:hypothetical protein
MTTFSSFSDLLPDPNNKINSAGAADASGSAGPGFAKVKFTSQNQVQVSRTISGRGVTSSPGYHMWSFDISYNPLTRTEFEPVASFLEGRQGRLSPFYVILPQHSAPQNATFASYCSTNAIQVATAATAGQSFILIKGLSAASGSPSPGDFFTVTDNADVNHKKAYKVVRVETDTTHKTSLGSPSQGATANTRRRIWTQPPLSRDTAVDATINFINPKFRVIQKGDTFEYDLETDNLYQFSLSLEEILP